MSRGCTNAVQDSVGSLLNASSCCHPTFCSFELWPGRLASCIGAAEVSSGSPSTSTVAAPNQDPNALAPRACRGTKRRLASGESASEYPSDAGSTFPAGERVGEGATTIGL